MKKIILTVIFFVLGASAITGVVDSVIASNVLGVVYNIAGPLAAGMLAYGMIRDPRLVFAGSHKQRIADFYKAKGDTFEKMLRQNGDMRYLVLIKRPTEGNKSKELLAEVVLSKNDVAELRTTDYSTDLSYILNNY